MHLHSLCCRTKGEKSLKYVLTTCLVSGIYPLKNHFYKASQTREPQCKSFLGHFTCYFLLARIYWQAQSTRGRVKWSLLLSGHLDTCTNFQGSLENSCIIVSLKTKNVNLLVVLKEKWVDRSLPFKSLRSSESGCLYKMSWLSIQQLFGDLSWDKGPTSWYNQIACPWTTMLTCRMKSGAETAHWLIPRAPVVVTVARPVNVRGDVENAETGAHNPANDRH